jgi:putative nucleotidyltransferase with HDIG domain
VNTLQRLAAVHKIALATSSAMELEEVFHNLLEITINTLSSEIGYILQYDQGKGLFRVRSFLSCQGISPKLDEIPFEHKSVSTLVYKTRKPVLVRDIDDSQQFSRQSILGYEQRSLICVPLIVHNEIIGTMAVVNKVDNSMYNSEDMKFLSTIASQAGLAIKNAKLHEEQKKAYMNIVHALVSMIDASDSYTKGHSDRVAFYSVELARKIKLPRNRIDIIERAAILHDIGKIGINVFLLNKEMQLSPEEIIKLRQHPLIGMKILEPLDFLRDVSICIGQHHERVDGTGYPYGIPGGKLLLESQILAIADAYDAMTSDRAYRLALSTAEAVKELKENAGKQHNPDLVRHFVELVESGRLDIVTGNSGIFPFPSTDFDPASEFFTYLSDRHLMPGTEESPQTHSCSSF